MNKFFIIIKVFLISFIFFERTFAVPPPDFIIQVISNIGIYLSMGVAIFFTFFGTTYYFLKDFFIKYKIYIGIFGFLFLFSIGYIFLYINNETYEKIEYIPKENERGWFNSDDVRVKKINTTELKTMIDNNQDIYILDAREDLENEIGSIPGSTHIRPADLKMGKWKELPKDKLIIVICYSGIRGKLVSSFLKSKGLNAKYLDEGISGWVMGGLDFKGEYIFGNVYNDKRYNLVFTNEQLDEKLNSGVKLIDAREPYTLNNENRINIANELSIMYTPSNEIESKFGFIKSGDEVIVICDDWVNCFDAKLVGVELEKRGVKFLGRFTNPDYLIQN